MNSLRRNEEQRELWGVSGPSLLAAAGLTGGVVGGLLIAEHLVFGIAAVAGAYCVVEAQLWSLRLDAKMQESTGEVPSATRLGRLRSMTRRLQQLYFLLILTAVLVGASLGVRGISLAERVQRFREAPSRAVAPPPMSFDEV